MNDENLKFEDSQNIRAVCGKIIKGVSLEFNLMNKKLKMVDDLQNEETREKYREQKIQIEQKRQPVVNLGIIKKLQLMKV